VSDCGNPRGYVEAINQGMARVKDCQLFFVILSTPASDIYNAVKQHCNMDFGIQSQCFLAKQCMGHRGLNPSVMTKVVIQINAKLGGAPWIVENPFPKKVWQSTIVSLTSSILRKSLESRKRE